MSWQHARAALDMPGIDPTAKFVLIAVALRAGTDGRAWPSVARICEDTGYGQAAVRAAIKRLAGVGQLEVFHRPGSGWTMALSAPPGGAVGAPANGAGAPPGREKRATRWREKRKEEIMKGATTGSSALRPAVADNGNGTSPGVVIHNGPAPGESWGEYRERGGR
jgi:Helix-turn-helix domain